MEMTSKERILNAIRGKETDRVPWSPFLAYYWEHLPQTVQKAGQVAYLKQMGADPLLRGFHQLFKTNVKNCEFHMNTCGKKRQDVIETKVGTLTEEYTYSDNANSWFLTSHAVKEEEDFKILQYVTEHTQLIPFYDDFLKDYHALGDGGVYLPLLGLYGKTGFQSMVERWCGTVELTYALYDFPEVVEECLAVIHQKDMETAEISVESPAEGFVFWEDSSTTNISPDFFQKYTAPLVDAWGKKIHSHDKLLIHHACGHLADLLPLMGNTAIDMAESVSPPPTGNIEIADAVKKLPGHVGIIGGIEPTFFLNCDIQELENCVEQLLQTMKGRRFVLANSDSCPPYVAYEKFIKVSEMLRRQDT